MNQQSMPLKVGVMGGASGDIPQDALHKAELLGEAVAELETRSEQDVDPNA